MFYNMNYVEYFIDMVTHKNKGRQNAIYSKINQTIQTVVNKIALGFYNVLLHNMYLLMKLRSFGGILLN